MASPERTRPNVTRIILGVVVAVVAWRLPYGFNPSTNAVFSEALYIGVAAAGLNLLTGYNGQISIGHGAFFGVGAFTSAILVVDHGWTLEWTLPVAALVAALVGVAVGFPALRVRGPYLALITLGLAVLFQPVAAKYIHGTGGLALYQVPLRDRSSTIAGLADDQYQYFVCLLFAALGLLLSRNLIRSRVGRAIIATRDRELAAATSGVNLAWAKVGTFALSAAYAGAAGGLSVLVVGQADATNPLTYFQLSIEFLVAVVIGGSATLTGPFIGAMVLEAIKRNTTSLIADKPILSPAVLGIALILIVYVLPDGIVGGLRRLRARVTRSASPPPSGPPPIPEAGQLPPPDPSPSTAPT